MSDWQLWHILIAVVSLSLSGSVMFVLYCLVKRCFQKYMPSRVFYALMLVIFLRLLTPWSPRYSLMNQLYARYDKTVSTQTASESQEKSDTSSSEQTTVSAAMQQQSAPSVRSAPYDISGISYGKDTVRVANRKMPWAAAVCFIWLTGTVIVLGRNVGAYLCLRHDILGDAVYSEIHTRMLRRIAHDKTYPDVFLSHSINTPMVLGLLVPVIVVPYADYSTAEWHDILCHELCHYRCGDLYFKWLGVLAGAAHWFNPLLPFMRKELEDTCEWACDESVTRRMDMAERKAYIRTILKTAERQVDGEILPLATLSGSARRLEQRFASIATPKKRTFAHALLSLTAILTGVAVGFSLGMCTFSDTHKKANVSHSLPSPITDRAGEISPLAPRHINPDTYAWYQYGFEHMGFEITDPAAVYDTARQIWTRPDDADGYTYKPTLTGATEQYVVMRSVFDLLNFEQYERIGETMTMTWFDGDAVYVDFYYELYFYLEKGGNLLVWLDFQNIHDYPHSREYPDYLEQDSVISVFDVPDDLYDKVAALLYPVAEQCRRNSQDDNLLLRYHPDDIGCDPIYQVLAQKLHVLLDDFGCDFCTEVTDARYEPIWNLFAGIGQCQQIQPRTDYEKTDRHIMRIGPETASRDDFGEGGKIDAYLVIYAEHNTICVYYEHERHQMWFLTDQDLLRQCEAIAASG